jgi:hypothetical protein
VNCGNYVVIAVRKRLSAHWRTEELDLVSDGEITAVAKGYLGLEVSIGGYGLNLGHEREHCGQIKTPHSIHSGCNPISPNRRTAAKGS